MKLITLHLLGPQEGVGGKLHVFMSTLPKLGLHALTPRQAGPATDNQQKQMALLPAHKGFQQMAEAAAEHQVLQRMCHVYVLTCTPILTLPAPCTYS